METGDKLEPMKDVEMRWEIPTIIASGICGFLFFVTTVVLACRRHPRKEKTTDIELSEHPENDPEVIDEPNQSLYQAQFQLNLEHEPSTWSLP